MMLTTPTRGHQTKEIQRQLRRLKLQQMLKIADEEIHPNRRQAWYRAAALLGMKISMRTDPDGVRVWRVK